MNDFNNNKAVMSQDLYTDVKARLIVKRQSPNILITTNILARTINN